MSIVLYPDPILARRAEPRPLDDSLRDVGARLLAAAQSQRAYGLAAAHIGAVEPVIVVSLGPMDKRDYRLFYNPEILSHAVETGAGTEGSVSLPGIEVEIVRPLAIELAYDDADGQRVHMALDAFPARVAQHEIDQMNGIFFLDRLSRLKRDAALRRFRKLAR